MAIVNEADEILDDLYASLALEEVPEKVQAKRGKHFFYCALYTVKQSQSHA